MPFKKKVTLRKKKQLRPSLKKRPKKQSMIKLIKQVINRKSEHKQLVYSTTFFPRVLQPTCGDILGNIVTLTPQVYTTRGPTIVRGDLNNQFIGNEFTISKYVHRYVIAPTPYNVTTNVQVTPCYVRLYYFKSKVFPTTDLTNATLFCGGSNFFANGGADTGFGGAMMDLARRIQSENWTYLTSKTYKIGNSNPNLSSGTTSFHHGTNNDFKLSIIGSDDLTRYFKGPIKINDYGSTTTQFVHMIVQVVSALGNILTTSQLPITIQSEMDIRYTDE